MNHYHNFKQIIAIVLVLFISSLSANTIFSILYCTEKTGMEEILSFTKKGEYKKAIPLLKKYNSQNPDRVEGCILLGKIYVAIGEFNYQDLAVEIFQEGLKRDPDNITILQFLSDLKKNKSMTEDATHYLEKAAAVDPTNFQIIEKLIENYITLKDKANLQKLEIQTGNWVKSHPDSVQGHLILGRLYLTLGKTGEAVKIFQEALKKKPDFTLIQRDLCDAYLMNGNAALFTETYYYWLNREKDGQPLNKEYQLLKLAMSEEDAMKFDKLPYKEKANSVVSYWRSQDPDPITIQNERLIEHFRRVEYSRSHLRSAISPLGFDDRGKVYIRWGPPEEKFTNPMPGLSAGYNDRFTDASGTTSGAGAVPPAATSRSIRGNESWYYPSIDYYMAFDFVSYGGDYRQVPSLVDAYTDVPAAQDANVGAYADWLSIQESYKERSHLGGIYLSLAGESPGSFAKTVTIDLPSEKVVALRSHAPRYEVKLDVPPLNYTVRPVQFRGDSGRTRIDVAYGLELNQLKPVPNKDTTFTFKFQNELVVFDSTNRRLLHRRFQQEQVNPPRYDYAKISFSGESVCELLPGSYKIAFQIIEISNKKGSFNKNDLKVRDFIGRDLMISDIKLSPQIKLMGIDEKTGREKLNIQPYPFTRVLKKQSILIYFEVYNLMLTPNQKTRYKISLRMEREVKKGEYAAELLKSFGRIFTGGKPQEIEISSQREGSDQTAIEYIALDLTALNSGHSRLTVTITDLNVEKQVENNIEFDLQ